MFREVITDPILMPEGRGDFAPFYQLRYLCVMADKTTGMSHQKTKFRVNNASNCSTGTGLLNR